MLNQHNVYLSWKCIRQSWPSAIRFETDIVTFTELKIRAKGKTSLTLMNGFHTRDVQNNTAFGCHFATLVLMRLYSFSLAHSLSLSLLFPFCLSQPIPIQLCACSARNLFTKVGRQRQHGHSDEIPGNKLSTNIQPKEREWTEKKKAAHNNEQPVLITKRNPNMNWPSDTSQLRKNSNKIFARTQFTISLMIQFDRFKLIECVRCPVVKS